MSRTNNEIVTVWITKYWESKGIFVEEGVMVDGYMKPNSFGKSTYDLFSPNQFTHTESEAIEKVRILAKSKIASLQSKIDSITEKWLK